MDKMAGSLIHLTVYVPLCMSLFSSVQIARARQAIEVDVSATYINFSIVLLKDSYVREDIWSFGLKFIQSTPP